MQLISIGSFQALSFSKSASWGLVMTRSLLNYSKIREDVTSCKFQ
jgi:hypothetical protein